MKFFPVGIHKTKHPKMKNHRGRTWDTGKCILPDGIETDGWLDTTWGEYFYFIHENQWYKGSIVDYDKTGSGWSLIFDLRPKITIDKII